jgi:hypothetical protein
MLAHGTGLRCAGEMAPSRFGHHISQRATAADDSSPHLRFENSVLANSCGGVSSCPRRLQRGGGTPHRLRTAVHERPPQPLHGTEPEPGEPQPAGDDLHGVDRNCDRQASGRAELAAEEPAQQPRQIPDHRPGPRGCWRSARRARPSPGSRRLPRDVPGRKSATARPYRSVTDRLASRHGVHTRAPRGT